MKQIALDPKEAALVGRLIHATVYEFYPTSWFDWDEVAALRTKLREAGVKVEECHDENRL